MSPRPLCRSFAARNPIFLSPGSRAKCRSNWTPISITIWKGVSVRAWPSLGVGCSSGPMSLAVYARQLALEPHLQILRRYRRSLLLRLEYARRPTLENHVHRITPVGTWVLINETWYYSKPIEYPPPLGHVLERFRN